MPSGIIIKGIGGFYYVKTSDGIYECRARGTFRKSDMSPLPGDIVGISIINSDKKIGSLDTINTRKNQFIRPAVANIDQLAIVTAVRSPVPDFILMDKLLAMALSKDIRPVICINKVDLDTAGEADLISQAYTKSGFKTILLSSVSSMGYDELEQALNGRITAFAGQSGVGKSTIINNIIKSIVMETGIVSKKIERGKHTTRHAELLELSAKGYVVDTPGFSSFELTDIKYYELENFYPEFYNCLNKCKFTGCSHISEPSCFVKEAVENGLIDEGRYSRYVQLYSALKQIKEFKK